MEFTHEVYVLLGLAIAVFIAEMFTMTFYAFFVSIGCALAAVFVGFHFSLMVALCSGGLLTTVCIVIFQRLFQKNRRNATPEETPFANLVGQRGVLSEGILGKGQYGAVVLDGTAWRACAEEAINRGSEVVVTGLDQMDRTTVVVKEIV